MHFQQGPDVLGQAFELVWSGHSYLIVAWGLVVWGGWSIGQLPLQASYQGPAASEQPWPSPWPLSSTLSLVIWSNWWSSAITINVSTLKLPQSISILLHMLQLDHHRDCQKGYLNCQHFKWSCHCSADVWCRPKAVSNPKCIFFMLEKAAFFCRVSADSLYFHSLYHPFLSDPWGCCWDGVCMTCPYRNPELNCWVKSGTGSQTNLVFCHWFLMWHWAVPIDIQKLLESWLSVCLWLKLLVHSLTFTPTSAFTFKGVVERADIVFHWAEKRAEKWWPGLT